MAMQAYLTIVDMNDKTLTIGASSPASLGSAYKDPHKDADDDEKKIHENRITVHGFSHQVMSALSPQTGQPAGGRIHKPVVITKIFDKSSPLLLEALQNGHRLKSVKIEWYRHAANGHRELYYTTKLKNAVIVEIKNHLGISQDPGNNAPVHMEEVHFNYLKISVTHVAADTSGFADWND